MMKKTIVTIVAALAVCAGASAQEAFKHLSVGLEIGTTGAGIQLALPVVSNHLVFTAGYKFPSVSISMTTTYPMDEINSAIDEVNQSLSQAGLPDRISTRFNAAEVTAKAKLNFGAVTTMLEYYPSVKSSFHIVAGLYIGTGDFLSAEGMTDKTVWANLKSVESEVNALKAKYSDIPEIQSLDGNLIDKAKATVNDQTVQLIEKNGAGYLDLQLLMPTVRPYLGVGFGRSIPDSHFGVQCDLGVWYHGKLGLTSKECGVAYDASAEVVSGIDDVMQVVEKIPVYPQISVRLVYRIF